MLLLKTTSSQKRVLGKMAGIERRQQTKLISLPVNYKEKLFIFKNGKGMVVNIVMTILVYLNLSEQVHRCTKIDLLLHLVVFVDRSNCTCCIILLCEDMYVLENVCECPPYIE
ncbi:hypothetical protein ACF0H5_022825 [Mactra antiquata]